MNNIHKKWSEAEARLAIQKAFDASKDVKIPDGPIVIDKDLLQEIRDALDNEATGTSNAYLADLCDKLDSLYPYLSC